MGWWGGGGIISWQIKKKNMFMKKTYTYIQVFALNLFTGENQNVVRDLYCCLSKLDVNYTLHTESGQDWTALCSFCLLSQTTTPIPVYYEKWLV